jgi:hypothetical protein
MEPEKSTAFDKKSFWALVLKFARQIINLEVLDTFHNAPPC